VNVRGSLSEILETARELGPASFSKFVSGIDPAWIEEALEATGTASIRRRKLPAERVVWLVLGMAMFAECSIRDVVDHLELVLPGTRKLAASAVPQSRYRLGADPIRWLFFRSLEKWTQEEGGLGGYKGFKLYGVDGTCLRVPDSDENFEHFGKPSGRNGTPNDAGYPVVRVACLMNLGTRLLENAGFGPLRVSEQELARQLWPSVPDQSLTIVDRGFADFGLFADLVSSGTNRHLMLRMRRDTACTEIEELPDGSVLADLRPGRDRLREQPDLPAAIRGRIVAYRHPDGQDCRLFVTLVDPVAYPAADLVRLYHDRWEIELAFDELKTDLLARKDCLRSKQPEGIAQEIWGTLLLYNIVRHEMLRVATVNKLPAKRISFHSSLLWMRNFWEVQAWRSRQGNIPRYLAEFHSTLNVLILPPRRGHRRYPRHVKVKMSKYARNRGKRSQETVDLIPEGP
jgi:hypothetical protein